MTQILGHHKQIQILNAALGSDRMHHAWVFAGPRGVGKFTVARDLARVLLHPVRTSQRIGSVTEEHDETTHQVEHESHPDLHIIRKEMALYSDIAQLRNKKLMNIPIDLIRERMLGGRTGDDKMREAPAYRTSLLGRGKVFIIDEAELMDRYSQNALLKTLEEPPPKTTIVLVTSRPDRLFPTVRSRCQLVRFGRLDEEGMTSWLHAHHAVPAPADRDWLLRFSNGAPGVADLAIRYNFLVWGASIDAAMSAMQHGAFPASFGAELADFVEQFAKAWVEQHDHASKDAANRDGVRHLLSILNSHARYQLHEAIGHDGDVRPWLTIGDRIREAEFQLDRSVNLKLVLENLVVQWTAVLRQASATAVG